MSSPLSENGSAAYLAAVDHLVNGHPTDAIVLLEPLAQETPSCETLLALAKCYLELRRGGDARDCLQKLIELEAPIDAGLRAYVLLLEGYASALAGDKDVAQESLEEVSGHDARLDSTVRSLRRQIQAGRKPLLRL